MKVRIGRAGRSAAVALLVVAFGATAQENPLASPPLWVGTFADAKVRVTLIPAESGFGGTLEVGGTTYDVEGSIASDGRLAGSFLVGERTFGLSAVVEEDTLVLTSGGTQYRLARRAGAEKAATTPDLSHVKVGQQYHFTLTNAGAPPMTMIYEVKTVGHGMIDYTTQIIMDMGQGPQPVGDPNPMEWRPVEAPATNPQQGGAAAAKITREAVTISGVRFDAMVIVSGNSTVWVPAPGDLPTFPGVLRVQTDGTTTMELTKIVEHTGRVR